MTDKINKYKELETDLFKIIYNIIKNSYRECGHEGVVITDSMVNAWIPCFTERFNFQIMSKTNECKSFMSVTKALHRKIQEEGKDLEDIDFIAVGGLGFNILDFWEVADKCSWDVNKLKDEFRIIFKDGTWISKHYSRDGSVRLKYHECPDKPVCILTNPMPQEFLVDEIYCVEKRNNV